MIDQDLIFGASEGDAWHARNSNHLKARREDPLCDLLAMTKSNRIDQIGSVCDVGCSIGERLARMQSIVGPDAQMAGFDASLKAIEEGRQLHHDFDLRQGLLDEPPVTGPFDLVSIGFVLHWVSRQRLAKAIAAIDGLIVDGGLLLIADFLPDRPCARRYHHRQDVELYTFKQDYAATFVGLGTYRELARITFSHGDVGQIEDAGDQDRAFASLLVKSLNYPVVDA